jgi:hypothetical protein
VEERSDSGDRDYYFEDQPSRKKLGFVLAPEQRNELSNVIICASWNRSSTKVALLLNYGTKLSELLLFRKADDGKLHQVEMVEPDPSALYRKYTGKTIPQPGDGYSENDVGPWNDENTVSLVSGEAIQTEDPDRYTHLLATYRAHVSGSHAEISNLKLLGPLSDAQSENFFKRWRH